MLSYDRAPGRTARGMNPQDSSAAWRHVSVMTTIINRLLAMFLLLPPAAWCQSPAEERTAAIDAVAADYVKAGKSPGLAVGVMRAGKIVLAKGYGIANVEQATPVTPDMVFRINSITKQLTATG